jgi:chaperonin GroES
MVIALARVVLEKHMQGKVIIVGKVKITEKKRMTATDVKKGDRILFSKYVGTEAKIDQKEHLIIREGDILGIIEA